MLKYSSKLNVEKIVNKTKTINNTSNNYKEHNKIPIFGSGTKLKQIFLPYASLWKTKKTNKTHLKIDIKLYKQITLLCFHSSPFQSTSKTYVDGDQKL